MYIGHLMKDAVACAVRQVCRVASFPHERFDTYGNFKRASDADYMKYKVREAVLDSLGYFCRRINFYIASRATLFIRCCNTALLHYCRALHNCYCKQHTVTSHRLNLQARR